MIRVGCAGWSFRDWDGVVYPKPKPKRFDPLVFLAGYFDTIELNTTFYYPARESSADSWLRRCEVNPRFRFTAKLWRRFTHERTEAWTIEDVRRSRHALDVLHDGGRLGAVLAQFPWSFRRTPENEDWLHALITDFQDLPLCVEIRHASWDEPEYLASLVERGVGFVNIDQPRFKNSIGPKALATSAVGYLRVHGRNWKDWFRKDADTEQRYDYLYSAEQLAQWADRASEVAAHPRVEDVYLITNNHSAGKGVVNALMLQAQLTGMPVRAPASLVAAYPEALAGLAFPEEGAIAGGAQA